MATSLPQMLSRTARGCRSSVVAAPSSSIASTSAAAHTACRSFTTSTPQQGPKPGAGQKSKKRTLKLPKNKSGNQGPKRSSSSDNDLSQLNLANQFLRPPKSMEHVPTLAADSMTLSNNLNAIMAYSDHQLASFGKFGLENKVTKNVSGTAACIAFQRESSLKKTRHAIFIHHSYNLTFDL